MEQRRHAMSTEVFGLLLKVGMAAGVHRTLRVPDGRLKIAEIESGEGLSRKPFEVIRAQYPWPTLAASVTQRSDDLAEDC